MDDMPVIAHSASPEMLTPARSKPPDAAASILRAERPDGSTPAAPPVRPYTRTPVRRVITRYAFEFFQDQIEQLRHRSLEQKLQGEDGSMSEMVREALDLYLGREEGTGS